MLHLVVCTIIVKVREVLARFITTPEAPVTADDLILTSGCSHSLQMIIEAIANPGDNILVPKPGFPLYSTLMCPHGIEVWNMNLLHIYLLTILAGSIL